MSAQDRFFEELQRAIARGFTLAAVSVSMSCLSPVEQLGGDSGVMLTDSGTAQSPRGVDGGLLAEVAEGATGCTGDAGTQGPYYGSCCTKVHCYTPTDGTCVASVHSGLALTPELPPGSGTCMCSQAGPFVSADGAQCCYLVGSIGCLGRPLREGEAAIVAAVVVRADWA